MEEPDYGNIMAEKADGRKPQASEMFLILKWRSDSILGFCKLYDLIVEKNRRNVPQQYSELLAEPAISCTARTIHNLYFLAYILSYRSTHA